MDAPPLAKVQFVESSVEVDNHAIQDILDELGLELNSEKRVQWQSSNREHPRNWAIARKAFDCGLILWLDCFT